MNGALAVRFDRIGGDGASHAVERSLAEEEPVAIEINGIGYAVLMATPIDLLDLGWGFALTERIIESAADVLDSVVHETPSGRIIRIQVAEPAALRIIERVRHRTTDSACGLCGVENLEQAMRPLPVLAKTWRGEDAAVFHALGQIDTRQTLGQETRAVHGAAACDIEGEIILLREDVGRHNAFDKLIGAMLRAGIAWNGGFALLTSRCSYELVEKAVVAGCPMLATISAPTTLAVTRAAQANLALRTLVRSDALLRSA
ncbi:formate dehydrogenase family accessory protein FdhD [Novosphingobium sp. Rr 2-17]|uniref:formate dehydrogenase accessory sulfurtransferase FdhD n=1 Tax=Novosphingobium sp. Rr 2-17 TaxID=555793 RepID=UPI000269950F|nr:formate dehydrogenase accessory sulfurtransferase FdhD [Novosphingobium sp. Rr 2-17]EIZ79868.1 formate dehydrogenase family accessory protein FdhD [Novosphingobium sp. Rr 2-17]